MKYKILVLILLLVTWCSVIFYASNKTSTESNMASKYLIRTGLAYALKITNRFKITEIATTEKNLNTIVEKLNYPLRKCAHATVYFFLAILVFILLKLIGLKRGLIFLVTITFCFLFSISDEYHQTFIEERTGQFSDCLIDTTGSLIGIGIMYLIYKKKKN